MIAEVIFDHFLIKTLLRVNSVGFKKVQLTSPDVRFNVQPCLTIVEAIWGYWDLFVQPGFWRFCADFFGIFVHS